MIRSPLGLRINPSPDRSPKEQIRQAASLGAKGVVLEASGDLGPDRLSETGRRELKHLLRSVELGLIALYLPTRRPFDTEEQLDDRLARADRVFTMAYEIGSPLVLARVGSIPNTEKQSDRSVIFDNAMSELGRRAEHRGVRLGVETGPDPGETLRTKLDQLDNPGLAASVDPAALLRSGHDPVLATRSLGSWVAHAYADDATGPSHRAVVSNPRGFGFPPGALDWEEYLGALEEIDYRGYVTIWPDPASDAASQFEAIKRRLDQF